MKNQSNDEFEEVTLIRDRYRVLQTAQQQLNTRLNKLSVDYEDKNREVINYERSMETKIMSLNNDIANLTIELD